MATFWGIAAPSVYHNVIYVSCLFDISFIFHFGVEGGILVLFSQVLVIAYVLLFTNFYLRLLECFLVLSCSRANDKIC